MQWDSNWFESLHIDTIFRNQLTENFIPVVWQWFDVRYKATILTHPTVGQTCKSNTLVPILLLLKSKFRLRMSTFASLHRLETLHFALSFRKKLKWRFVCVMWRWFDVRWMAWYLTHPTVGQTCESDTLVLTWKLLKSPNRSRISTLKFIQIGKCWHSAKLRLQKLLCQL